MKSVLVTGGTGFLGSHVVAQLCDNENFNKVFVSTRVSGREFPPKILPVKLELLSNDLALPMGVHTLVHVAGEKSNPALMMEVNHFGTRKLLEAAGRAQVKRFIFVSSVGVYGAPPHSGVIHEDFARSPNNLYEKSKNAGENCIKDLAPRLGLEYLILQPSNVIGLVQGSYYPLLGLMRMIQRGYFSWFGNQDPWVNYVAVEDAAAAVVDASIRGGSGQTYIINTPERLRSLVDWITFSLDMTSPARHLPWCVGKLVASLGDTLQALSGRSLPFNGRRFLELTNTTRYEGGALTRSTGFTYPLGLKRAISNLVDAYLVEGKL